MTPDGTHLLALYNTSSATGSVAKIAAGNGELSWQKQIPLEGRAIENGWIDRRGDVFLTSSVEGYAIWKFDSECEHEKGYFKAGPGFTRESLSRRLRQSGRGPGPRTGPRDGTPRGYRRNSI